MVLSTEYSEAVNARCTFQPLWVSVIIQTNNLAVNLWRNRGSLILQTKNLFVNLLRNTGSLILQTNNLAVNLPDG